VQRSPVGPKDGGVSNLLDDRELEGIFLLGGEEVLDDEFGILQSPQAFAERVVKIG
jgi:hypothetical protein